MRVNIYKNVGLAMNVCRHKCRGGKKKVKCVGGVFLTPFTMFINMHGEPYKNIGLAMIFGGLYM